MFRPSGRKNFRSPFPLDQTPHSHDLSLEEERSLAEKETQRIRSASPPASSSLADANLQHGSSSLSHSPHNNSSLADVETRKNPSVSSPSHQSANYSVQPEAQNNTHSPYRNQYNGASAAREGFQSISPSSVGAFQTYNPSTAGTKRGRHQVSKRKRIVLACLAIVLLVPTFLLVFELISAFALYKQMQDGVAHLQAAERVFQGNPGAGTAKYFARDNLLQARQEIDAAHADFASAGDTLDHDGAIALASHLWPLQISTARSLGHIAADGTAAAQQLISMAIDIAPSIAPALQKSLPQNDNAPVKPFITPSSFDRIFSTLGDITPLAHDMYMRSQGLDLNALPISEKQRQLITSLLPLLPVLDVGLAQVPQWSNTLRWFLGVDSPRSFLIEPMDSSELRATGGFTGQFGELLLNGGHTGPLKLANIGKFEEDHTSEGSPPDETIFPKVIGQSAPAPYSAWWPVGNFGLRDANLSADFPTSAKIAMDRYSYEFGKSVDGVIMFTPGLIRQVLHVTGPIAIPAYNQTITEQNLESLLHYYQLDNTGIRQEQIIEHVKDNQVARKLFTQRVTTTLISTVTHLPLNKLLPMANEMLRSMKSRDLQIYVTNAQLESLLGKYGSTASMDRSPDHDGLFIVQSNLSASKASQYVTTAEQDTITLNSQGGATHHLQLTLNYQQTGPVYGLDTYRDYIRVYVPANSQLLAGNGFDQYARPYCGDDLSGYRLCAPDVYGDGSLVCTPPVSIGFATSYLNDPYARRDHPLDLTGVPQNQQSDEAGRAMFGGWVVIPKNCVMQVTLSWYVPPQGQHDYTFLLQNQASISAQFDLTLQPASSLCAHGQSHALQYSHGMDGADISFTLKRQGTTCSLAAQ